MFVSHNALWRSHAGYVALALVIGVMLTPFPSAELSAQSMNMPGMKNEMPTKDGATKTATATGTVTAVNAASRKITFDHGPIPDIDWPAMKMEFPVASSVDLSNVRTGDRVRFTLRGSGNSYTVQSISPGQ